MSVSISQAIIGAVVIDDGDGWLAFEHNSTDDSTSVSFKLTDELKDQLRQIVRTWDNDEQGDAVPVCDHCGRAVESTESLRIPEWRHTDSGSMFCRGICGAFAKVNGTDKVPVTHPLYRVNAERG